MHGSDPRAPSGTWSGVVSGLSAPAECSPRPTTYSRSAAGASVPTAPSGVRGTAAFCSTRTPISSSAWRSVRDVALRRGRIGRLRRVVVVAEHGEAGQSGARQRREQLCRAVGVPVRRVTRVVEVVASQQDEGGPRLDHSAHDSTGRRSVAERAAHLRIAEEGEAPALPGRRQAGERAVPSRTSRQRGSTSTPRTAVAVPAATAAPAR